MKTALRLSTLLAIAFCVAPVHAEETSQPPDLSGTWALIQTTATTSSVAVIGDVKSSTRATLLYRVSQEQSKITGKGTLCDLEIDSGSSMVDTVVPSSFKKALPVAPLEATLEHKRGQWSFSQPRTRALLGVNLGSPNDPLPTDPKDKRVTDPDKDGNPGATIKIDGLVSGEIYVIQRGWSQMTGAVLTPKEVRGRVAFQQEQVILGTTNRLLDDPPEARPDPSRSRFIMKKLSKGATCREAIAAAR